jgi:hypothetical protein
MELEELKNIWTSLDGRLGKQELLNEYIIRKMFREKSGRSVGKLLNAEFFSLTVLILSVPAVIWLWFREPDSTLMIWFCITLFLTLAYGITASALHIYYLMKLDFTRAVKINYPVFTKFNRMVRVEKIISIVVIAIMYLFGILLYATRHASVVLWVYLGCIYIVGALSTWFSYKKIYDRNILIIRENLEELKELDE